MIVEICTSNYTSVHHAVIAGADRIELCVDLQVGGVTPPQKLVERVFSDFDIPVFILIRDRGGNFVFNNDEVEKMISDIQCYKSLGCQGIVSGALTFDQHIDIGSTYKLIEAAMPLPFTFHRAFDLVVDPLVAIDQLVDLGVQRILTSGQQTEAVEGLDELCRYQEHATDRLTILPGGGIRPDNVRNFYNRGFEEVHSSAIVSGDVSDMETIKALKFGV